MNRTAAIDREEVARMGFYRFVELAWPQVAGGVPFVPGWHLEEICAHLEAVTRGELRRLLISIPPGCSKSTVTSVLWPAWDWIVRPTRKWIVAGAVDSLVRRDATNSRALVSSPWFAERWGRDVAIASDDRARNTQTIYSTTAGGRRLSVTVGGNQTLGWHGDRHVIDDPNSPEAFRDPLLAASEMDRIWHWWTHTMAGRVANPLDFAQVVIMHRLGDNDLIGRLLETQPERWTYLLLPMLFEPERACHTQWGGDRRAHAGDLLCPARFDERWIADKRVDMGARGFAAQFQQRPAPQEGNIFKRDWFAERWVDPPECYALAISADCSFKDTPGADYVAIHVWGMGNGKFYLLDRIHDRMGLPETVRAILALVKRWPRATAKLIEDKANGPAVEQLLRDKVPGIVMMEPKQMGGSKVARANAVAPLAEAGSIVLPAPHAKYTLGRNGSSVVLSYEWIDEFVEELCTFPSARHDDDVDAFTQACIYLHERNPGRYVRLAEAMKQRGLTA